MASRGHHLGCTYPSDPCSCRRDREYEATHHEQWCDFPHGPCDCGMERRATKFREMEGRDVES